MNPPVFIIASAKGVTKEGYMHLGTARDVTIEGRRIRAHWSVTSRMREPIKVTHIWYESGELDRIVQVPAVTVLPGDVYELTLEIDL